MYPEEVKLAYRCMKTGDLDGLRGIFDKHSSLLKYKFVGGASWLHEAALYKLPDVVKFFIEMGIPVDVENDLKDTPLVIALGQGNSDVAEVLLDSGACIDYGVGWRATPLISAIYSGSLDTVKLLLDRGANINQPFGEPVQNPLDFAHVQNQEQIADYLVSCGAVSAGEDETEGAVEEYLRSGYDVLYELEIADKDLKIFVAPPSETRDCITLITDGMSNMPMNVPDNLEDYRYAELMINLPSDWLLSPDALMNEKFNWPVDWLIKIAKYPFQNDIYLGEEFSIIENGQPPEKISSSVDYTCFLLFLSKAEFYRPVFKNGKRVNIYTVFPIYTEEKEYEENNGVHSLLSRFKELGIDIVVNATRENAGIN